MVYKTKAGRKKAKYKLRSVEGIMPQGFTFQGYSRKRKALVYRRVD